MRKLLILLTVLLLTTSLSAQFDALFHVDETSAVEPFDITERWSQHEAPETYPFGL